MGLAATSARKFMLMAHKMNLQFDLQQIAQARLRLMSIIDKVYAASSSWDPNHPMTQQHDRFIEQLQGKDKRIALIQEKIKQQASAIDQEMQSLDKIIESGIKQNFTYIA